MRTVNMHEAKIHLSRLVKAAAEGEPFVIARAGKPVVKVTAVLRAGGRALPRPGPRCTGDACGLSERDAEQRLPKALRGNFFDAEGRAEAEQGVATMNLLDISKGYVRDGGVWDSDSPMRTRINDGPQVTLRLARVCEDRVEPYARHAAGDEAWRAWRLSEVTVSAGRVGGETVPSRHACAARAANAQWTRFDEEKILVVLEGANDDGRAMTGSASAGDGSGAGVRISYDPVRGLELKRDS